MLCRDTVGRRTQEVACLAHVSGGLEPAHEMVRIVREQAMGRAEREGVGALTPGG